MKRIILIVTLICITISCSAFMVKRKKDPGYLYARKYGAKANIELHVVDDDGKPIPEENYTTPGTGPYWDKRMVSAEMQDVVKEVQDYIGGK